MERDRRGLEERLRIDAAFLVPRRLDFRPGVSSESVGVSVPRFSGSRNNRGKVGNGL
jgi:hypothetical protein